MNSRFERTESLLGKDALEALQNARVAVIGLGGVGSFAMQALARSGVENFVLVDADDVALSNINRQALAFESTLGQSKVEVAQAMVKDINPEAHVEAHKLFITEENAKVFLDECQAYGGTFSYIVDAVDSLQAKVALAKYAQDKNIPLISCMGTAGKLDATRFEFADIYETKTCPLCRSMRQASRKAGVESLDVLYSQEESKSTTDKRAGLGTVSWVPSAAGLLLAGRVIKRITGLE